MDYTAVIWHRPEDYRRAPTMEQTQKLAMVQRRAMIAITGCFRTTSTSALEAEMGIPPPRWHLHSKILKTTTQMLTYPKSHPISKWIKQAVNNENSKHLSNLENLAKRFPEHMKKNMAKIQSYIRPP